MDTVKHDEYECMISSFDQHIIIIGAIVIGAIIIRLLY